MVYIHLPYRQAYGAFYEDYMCMVEKKQKYLGMETMLQIINICKLYISNCEIGRIVVTTGTMI
jgi:hypothetical protein